MHNRVNRTKEVVSKEVSSIDFNDRRVGKWGLLALILIVAGFIIVPLMSGVFDTIGSSKLKFGSYKRQPIYYEKDNKFAQYVNYYSNFYSNLTKNNNSVDIEYFIWNLAFMKYVEDIAFIDLAKTNGFYISKSILNKNLKNSPAYLDSKGNFSPKRYKKVSDYQRFKIHSNVVENLLSSNMKILLNSSFMLSDSILNAVKSMSEVRRNISYIMLSYQDFPREEIISYADKNSKLFKSLDIASIHLKNLNDANDAYDKLTKGTPFEEVAKFYSKDMANFKGVASFKKYYFDLDLMFEKKEDLGAIFSLKVNEFTKPIKSKNRGEYEIYKVLSDVYDFNKDSEHDISSARNYIETYEPSVIETFLENKLNGILDEINSTELMQVIKNHRLTLKDDIVNLSYNMNVYPNTLKELSAFSNSKDFYDIIFSLKKGQWSNPFLADRRVYLFYLRSDENSYMNFDDLVKEDRLFDEFFQANNKLVLDSVLNRNDFKDNFYEAFFSLQLKMNN
ncbi:peptidylprolyl isomerase [Borrelia sp. HM]|uniref:peptidylprolyl isomerase n=1 Tax=Borrelia sp. HM TaxID=1882662 RepID=UPI001C786288|nr:peptidylprolyl isomerase [Borrelia sp. HM]BCR21487.1 hypothetical protein BKFM_00047 [Borrelia sp. HM]